MKIFVTKKKNKHNTQQRLTLENVEVLRNIFVEILPQVKQSNQFICSRLYNLRYFNSKCNFMFTDAQIHMATDYVMNSLGAAATIEGWLKIRGVNTRLSHECRIEFVKRNIKRFNEILEKYDA